MLAAPLVCVVGFQNSQRNKGAKRRRNNRTLTGLCVALRQGWGGAHPSCSLYFSKPSLTYPSIIEKEGDSIHHACCGVCHPELKGMPKTGTEQLVFSTCRRTSYVAIVIPSSTAALSLYVWVLSTSLWTCHPDSFLQIVL